MATLAEIEGYNGRPWTLCDLAEAHEALDAREEQLERQAKEAEKEGPL